MTHSKRFLFEQSGRNCDVEPTISLSGEVSSVGVGFKEIGSATQFLKLVVF